MQDKEGKFINNKNFRLIKKSKSIMSKELFEILSNSKFKISIYNYFKNFSLELYLNFYYLISKHFVEIYFEFKNYIISNRDEIAYRDYIYLEELYNKLKLTPKIFYHEKVLLLPISINKENFQTVSNFLKFLFYLNFVTQKILMGFRNVNKKVLLIDSVIEELKVKHDNYKIDQKKNKLTPARSFCEAEARVVNKDKIIELGYKGKDYNLITEYPPLLAKFSKPSLVKNKNLQSKYYCLKQSITNDPEIDWLDKVVTNEFIDTLKIFNLRDRISIVGSISFLDFQLLNNILILREPSSNVNNNKNYHLIKSLNNFKIDHIFIITQNFVNLPKFTKIISNRKGNKKTKNKPNFIYLHYLNLTDFAVLYRDLLTITYIKDSAYKEVKEKVDLDSFIDLDEDSSIKSKDFYRYLYNLINLNNSIFIFTENS